MVQELQNDSYFWNKIAGFVVDGIFFKVVGFVTHVTNYLVRLFKMIEERKIRISIRWYSYLNYI